MTYLSLHTVLTGLLMMTKMNEMELVFSNYKEPLKKVEGGFGYWGALGMTANGSLVQCHECGKLVKNLGIHAFNAHGLRAMEYRDKYKLSHTTSLVSETFRNELKANMLRYLASLTPQERKKRANHLKSFLKQGHTVKQSLESKNKHGYCPDQLLQKILDVKKILGRVPTTKEFRDEMNKIGKGRAFILIYNTFGSWNKALQLLKLPINEKQYTTRWNDETLLGLLKEFYERHNRLPTKSDCLRGLLPSLMLYRTHFGGLPRARRLAGLPLSIGYAAPALYKKRK